MPIIGNPLNSVAFLTDSFNGNGSTTAFTMSVAPATSSSILVVITGVTQNPTTYSVVGTTLTFSTAPPSGTANISVRYLGIPASGVTTTAYRTLTEFTATASQTTFTPPSYTVGFIAVYQNGVMLGSADYTASNGTTVVLAVGALVGDLVTTESFYVSSVLNALPVTGGTISGNLVVTGTTTLTGGLNTPLAVTSGGTGVATSTGSGAGVHATSPTLTTPVINGFTGDTSVINIGSGQVYKDASGNVGIGTSSPARRLDVSAATGLIGVTSSTGTNYAVFQALNTGGTMTLGLEGSTSAVFAGSTAYSAIFGTGGAYSLHLATNNTVRATIDSSGNFLFNSGYGSVATAYGCRAWVNFNGTGTVAIRGSGNVSSITDNGTGNYTVNFTTAMADTNYTLVESSGTTAGVNLFVVTANTGSVVIYSKNYAGGFEDNAQQHVSIFR